MRNKLFLSTILPLILLLQMASRAEAKRCTISCESDRSVKCSSKADDCVYSYGAYDYIICDGVATQCPLPPPPGAAASFDALASARTCSSCTVTCPNNPNQSCTSETGQCDSGLVGGTFWIGCDGNQDECVPPR
jgi:hypothetical protein